jgi:hypothetical protein
LSAGGIETLCSHERAVRHLCNGGLGRARTRQTAAQFATTLHRSHADCFFATSSAVDARTILWKTPVSVPVIGSRVSVAVGISSANPLAVYTPAHLPPLGIAAQPSPADPCALEAGCLYPGEMRARPGRSHRRMGQWDSWLSALRFLVRFCRDDFFPRRRGPQVRESSLIDGQKEPAIGREL